MVVGLTGGIGSGKTTVAKIFDSYDNVIVYNADIEAKKLMNSSDIIKQKLITEFGNKAYVNNELNRSLIAKIAFNNKKMLNTLNSIVHPEVYKHLHSFVKNNQDKSYIIYENAILFENKSDFFCDKIITVTAPLKIRINRVMKRDNVSEKNVKNRIKNQWKENLKTIQSNYIVINEKLKKTESQVIKIHNKIINRLQ